MCQAWHLTWMLATRSPFPCTHWTFYQLLGNATASNGFAVHPGNTDVLPGARLVHRWDGPVSQAGAQGGRAREPGWWRDGTGP